MESDPALPVASGSLPLRDFIDPLLVDPGPALLRAVVDAFREAAPALVDPDIDELRAAATAEGDPLAEPTGLPPLTVLADEAVVDGVTERFSAASRLAALVEADVCRLLTGTSAQPNPALAGEDRGCVLVPAGRGDSDGGGSDDDATRAPDRWVPIGDDPSLRERYASLVGASTDIEEYGLRTPSRHRVYAAFRSRCDTALADGVIRAIDIDPVPGADESDVDPRTRAYAVGICHGALDGDLRRACEDAGLGSRSTFTRIKRELREAGLLATEPVPQPVGRPRERLVARGALADAESPPAIIAAVRAGVA